MARTDLSLGNLYRAVSGSVRTSQAVSISGLNGGGTNISMLGFAFDSVSISVPTYTYIVEGTLETCRFDFSLSGSQFVNKIQNKTTNYTCSIDNANFTVGAGSIQPAGHTTVPLTAASIGTTTYAEASSSLTLGYADGYNINATNHGITGKITKTIYAVDVYNTVNQPDFCLLFGTKIQLADGTELNVEDLVVGDEIKAWVPDGLPDETLDGADTAETEWRFFLKDELSGTTQNVVVSDLTFNFASSYYSINNGLIEATGKHPLYVWDNEIQKYKFKNVENILIGDRLVMENQTEVEVINTENINADVEIVTINVETADVYLANGFISHNKGTTTQPYIPANGLRMYFEPAKSGSYATNTFPAAGALTADVLDLAGYQTAVRPGTLAPLSLAGSSPSFVAGTTRKTRYFDFSGDILYKDSASSPISKGMNFFNTNSGSIHMWIKPIATIGGVPRRIFFGYGDVYQFGIASTDNTAYNRLLLSGSTSGLNTTVSGSISITSGSWYMVSAVFRPAGTCTIYLDGTSVASATSPSWTTPTTQSYLAVGSNVARTTQWNASIGPVLFYNVAHSSTEVSQIYNHFSPSYK